MYINLPATMDLTQRKLTKAEWSSIEVPVSPGEKRINDLIIAGYNNVNLQRNPTVSLLKYMKIAFSEQVDTYLHVHYFQPTLIDLSAKYGFRLTAVKSNEHTMKKADLIRLNNTDGQLHLREQKDKLFEFILLDLLTQMCRARHKTTSPQHKTWMNMYYTMHTLLTYAVEVVNRQFVGALQAILSQVQPEISLKQLIYNGQALIEQNMALLTYANETLYEHQKELFTLCKQPQPKLILYIAPTGTGKTLSPLGLAEKHKVIFVCAARHVGLALAKAAVSAQKKVAFAFGCTDAQDIRLHYFAAKEYSLNKKSGGIGKVDNSVGDKVELMISDIQSYLPAMYYMLAFNPKEKIILYWDEPTITLDYKEHAFHAIIKTNWTQNLIPNVVLSSATLPHRVDLVDTINDFCGKFDNAEIHEIVSYDCKKTIPLINKEGFVEMPHYLSADYTEVQKIVKHCLGSKTLLRYLDLGAAVDFIKYVTEGSSVAGTTADAAQAAAIATIAKNERLLNLQFPTIDAINMNNLKVHYLHLLGNIPPPQWPELYTALAARRVKRQPSNIHIVTTDAHTLTDGPTIFLAENVEKVAHYYIQNAHIPPQVLADIMTAIEFNSTLTAKILRETKDLEDDTNKDEGKEKKAGNIDRMDPKMKQKLQNIQQLQAAMKMIVLGPQYIPNTTEHLYKYANHLYNNEHLKNKPFTSNVSEDFVEKIMQIDDIEDHWKLLLMMGIGVFTTHKSDRYMELMKSLVQEQKLYLIIASSDFIYGTNYQFCHGYISKDLGHMSQEKCIQTMGRVGRTNLQHDYSVRFRENDLILKLFQPEENKPEVLNMNLLFNDSP
jgi:hypothetical protein